MIVPDEALPILPGHRPGVHPTDPSDAPPCTAQGILYRGSSHGWGWNPLPGRVAHYQIHQDIT